jgi:heme-degrading monooxygenase HmoA
MPDVWTHGTWTVRPGREDEFVAAWRELVPLGTALGGNDPRLLRDRERPNVFVSFGSWPNVETIERFRRELGPRLRQMNELLESFETKTLDEAYPVD